VTEPTVRVLIVDDHPLVRATLAEVLAQEDGVTVVGECADGAQVVETAARLRPDVITMDLSMPGMGGLAATEALRAAGHDVRVVVLTAEPSARSEVAAAGADALLPKSARSDVLLGCLRAVAAGAADCPYCL
jgi:DNA-binding NarL/FixJ family response regulator